MPAFPFSSYFLPGIVNHSSQHPVFTQLSLCIPLILETKIHTYAYPVAVRSKAWDCGRSIAAIVGSNPAGGMDVCVL
jgi:hypothetical protein